jgi:hypothetical protein
MILQATHGVVSGNPAFFKRAFGESVDEFENLLLRPHHFIFHRVWYEEMGGTAEFESFSAQFRRLSESEKIELDLLLSSTDPRNFRDLVGNTKNKKLKNILPYYYSLTHAEEATLWEKQKSMQKRNTADVAEDELVEDAGLEEPMLSVQRGQGTSAQLSLL